jgi:hypothetical protein
MTKFSQDIIGQIKKQHLAPVPRWHFLLKNYSLWTAFCIAVILGSLSFSVIMERLIHGDWEVIGFLGLNPMAFLFLLLPYFWLLFLALFFLLAYFEWKHTRNSYRLKTYYIVVGSIGVSAVLGSSFYCLGMGKQIDSVMASSIPYYHTSLHANRDQIWLKPEKGLLTGEVEKVDEAGVITVKDGNGEKWQVFENEQTITQFQNIKMNEKNITPEKKAIIEKKKIGDEVAIIGEKNEGGNFVAKKIKIVDDDGDDEEDMLEREGSDNDSAILQDKD